MLTVQTSTSKGVPSAKNPGLKKVPKPNFDTTAAKDVTTRMAIVKPQSRKQIKTQTGSVKDEPSVCASFLSFVRIASAYSLYSR